MSSYRVAQPSFHTMKPCPFCAEQVQDAAVVCRFCNRELSAAQQPNVAQVTSAPAQRTAASKVRFLTLATLASVLIVVFAISITAGPDTFASQSPSSSTAVAPAVTRIAERKDLEVQAEAYQYWTWTAEPSQPNCHVTGHLEVLGGGNRDIMVYVMTEDNFQNLSNGHDAKANFQTGKVTAVTLNVTLTAAGRYVLAISNSFSVMTPKRVRAEDVKVTCQ
jgi:hypothetical protein